METSKLSAFVGAEFKVKILLLVLDVVLNAEALGAVLIRRTESLCKVTRDVPNELAEDEVPGVYVYPAVSDLIDKVESDMRR